MLSPFIQGFGMGGGLIVAIGSQNAFVLSQGVRKSYPVMIPLICIICDAILICLGVAGTGTLVASNTSITTWATWGGAAFLFWYGFTAFRSAARGGRLESDGKAEETLRSAVLATLAVTLLNPHVYIDTVLLLGSVSSRFGGNGRLLFGAGAVAASFVWFTCLSLGGRMLAPLFKRPVAWRILDSLVCVTMWSIAVSLVRQATAGV